MIKLKLGDHHEPENIEGLLIDLDGTLVKGAEELRQQMFLLALTEIESELGEPIPITYEPGISTRNTFQQLIHQTQDAHKKQKYQTQYAYFLEVYEKYRKDRYEKLKSDPRIQLHNDVTDFLEALHKKQFALCAQTTAPRDVTRTYFERFGLGQWFNGNCVQKEDVQYPKPHPETFQVAAERINIAPEHCAALEDSIAGLEAAVKARIGMVIFIDRRENPSWETLSPELKSFCSENNIHYIHSLANIDLS